MTLLFFLVGQIDLRNYAVSMFSSRDSKLRFLKIMRDIERNLAGYLTVVTIVNIGVGSIVALGTWAIGYPNPLIFGLIAALLNYVPYIGPATMVIALFGVGLVTFPSLGQAFIAPLGLIAVTTLEGHFVTPTIVGRKLTLNPLMVFLALAFWTWMWGPVGRGPGRADFHRRPGYRQPSASAEDVICPIKQVSHYWWNFLPDGPLSGQPRPIPATET